MSCKRNVIETASNEETVKKEQSQIGLQVQLVELGLEEGVNCKQRCDGRDAEEWEFKQTACDRCQDWIGTHQEQLTVG